MRAIRGLITLFGALWIGCAAVQAADTQPPNLILSVIPNTLKLAPGGKAQTAIIANIPTTMTVQSITLSAFADVGIDVMVENGKRNLPPLNGAQAWTAVISGSSTGIPEGKVHFRADFQIQVENGQVVPGVTIAPLKIEQRVPDPIDKVIKADLQTALETLLDEQSRQVFLVVQNISYVPVTVTDIRVSPIPRVNESVPKVGEGFRLEPQQSHPFPITLTAEDRVQSGKHLLVVRIDAAWEQDGQRNTGSVVRSKDLQVGVFGESAILQATTIPSVMLLPGFLLLTTFLMLVRWTTGSSLLELDFKKPEFWLFAITISLLAIVFYPYLTGPFLSRLFRRPMAAGNYLQGYGFKDILYLWFGAILVAIIAWAIVVMGVFVRKGITYICAWYKRYMRARLIPTSNDSPLAIVRKIAKNKESFFDLREVTYPAGDPNAQSVFVLPPECPESGKIWVCPQIRVKWIKVEGNGKGEFDRLLNDRQAILQVIDKLEQWQRSPQDPTAKVDWDSRGPHVTGPKEVEQNQTQEVRGSGNSFIWLE